jgi:hypothetical protein
LDKTHNGAVRQISARVLAQLHQVAKRGRIQRIGRRVGVSWVMSSQLLPATTGSIQDYPENRVVNFNFRKFFEAILSGLSIRGLS